MNIAYVINGLNGGGAAFPMTQVLGLLRELGHEVRVLALSRQDGKAAARLEQAGIPFEVLSHGGRTAHVAPAVRLLRRLRDDRPDLLWTSLTRGTLYGQLAGRLLGIPVVSWQHSDFLKPGNLALLRRTRSLSMRWIADSEAVLAFAGNRLGIPRDRIETWAPFIADPGAPTSRPWTGEGPFRLGTLGRLHHSKQYDVLLHALARVRDLDPDAYSRLEMHVGGDGPEQATLVRLAGRLGLSEQMRFAGFVAPGPFLAGLHGYLQTSLKEGFCIAVHEAMQAALPVVTTRVGQPAHSVVHGETGWLCEVGDVDALAHAILALARDPERAAMMGRRARARVLEDFSGARFRRTGERLVERIAAESAARRGPATRGTTRPASPRAATTALPLHMRAAPASPLPILTYHHIGEPPNGASHRGLYLRLDKFRSHLRVLAENGIRGVSMDEGLPFLRGERDGRVAVITFDDGYLDNLELALPALHEHGFQATCYLVADRLGGSNDWDRDAVGTRKTLMSASQVREWLAAGMRIGSHTRTHPRLTRLDPAGKRREIVDSKAALEDRFGIAIEHFCFPYGDHDDACVRIAREAGYATAVTTVRGRVQSGHDLLALPRVGNSGRRSPRVFQLRTWWWQR